MAKPSRSSASPCRTRLRLACGGLLLAMVMAAPTRASDIVVYHDWGAPAELAALNVLRAAVETRGHRWLPLAIPHDGEGAIDVLELIAAGTSPNVFLQMQPRIYRALDTKGQLLHLDDQFARDGLLAQLPEVVRASITIDGAILKVPATIHADTMVYYNRAVAKASGVDPQSWTSLADMWADFPAVRAAGYLPVAIGAQPWQIGYLTHGLVASLGGSTLYTGLYGAAPDRASLDSPALLEVFAWLRRFAEAADDEAPGRDWNMATNMVISGQALLQVQGDWMKGEWRAAGKTSDSDFGCLLLPGALALAVSVDSWGLLGGVDAQAEAAERDFAEIMIDPQVQADFAAAKGSTPVRLDARAGVDACSQKLLTALDRPDFAQATPHLTAPPEWIDAIWTVANAYWDDATMTPDQAIAQLKAAWDTLN